MGFNQSIVENALLSCGRHCCVCHKFCGTKIELHHIDQKKNGGEDSFDIVYHYVLIVTRMLCNIIQNIRKEKNIVFLN
ncbi:MAG TPA: hypothetical protein VIH02_05575 [Flavobacterium sp.]